MPSIKTHISAETEIEITSEFCYTKAAECLLAVAAAGNIGYYHEGAKEWRLLGDSLRDAEAEALWRQENN